MSEHICSLFLTMLCTCVAARSCSTSCNEFFVLGQLRICLKEHSLGDGSAHIRMEAGSTQMLSCTLIVWFAQSVSPLQPSDPVLSVHPLDPLSHHPQSRNLWWVVPLRQLTCPRQDSCRQCPDLPPPAEGHPRCLQSQKWKWRGNWSQTLNYFDLRGSSCGPEFAAQGGKSDQS